MPHRKKEKPTKTLERKTWSYALKVNNQKLLPATIIGAEISRIRKVESSGGALKLLGKKIKQKLLALGELGKIANGNVIGFCAEVNAANKLISERPNIQVEQIVFSNAIRPRTMQKIKTCKNCKATFK